MVTAGHSKAAGESSPGKDVAHKQPELQAGMSSLPWLWCPHPPADILTSLPIPTSTTALPKDTFEDPSKQIAGILLHPLGNQGKFPKGGRSGAYFFPQINKKGF